MKRIWILLLALLLTGCTKEVATVTEPTKPVPVMTELAERETLPAEPADSDFVRVTDYIPGIRQELKYAPEDNFTGQVIYDFRDAYLRYGTVKKLKAVSEDLAEMGLYIKIWDGFRPVSAQEKLWQVCPDPTYVSHPVTGRRAHCRGNAVDVTLYDLQTGELLDMPTGFDDFSKRADRNYADCTQTQKENALLLENAMKDCGFKPYSAEWWHYTDRVDYPVDEAFDPSVEQ